MGRHQNLLPTANIEKGILPAGGYIAHEKAGQTTRRVQARRRASGPGALGRAPIRDGESLVRPGCGSWRMPAARQGTSIRIETSSSDSGFDFKLPCY